MVDILGMQHTPTLHSCFKLMNKQAVIIIGSLGIILALIFGILQVVGYYNSSYWIKLTDFWIRRCFQFSKFCTRKNNSGRIRTHHYHSLLHKVNNYHFVLHLTIDN
jgi:uncharacterized membrane protein YdbT with pleckstrin-like domain